MVEHAYLTRWRGDKDSNCPRCNEDGANPEHAVVGCSHFARERVHLRWRKSSAIGTIGRASTQGSGSLIKDNLYPPQAAADIDSKLALRAGARAALIGPGASCPGTGAAVPFQSIRAALKHCIISGPRALARSRRLTHLRVRAFFCAFPTSPGRLPASGTYAGSGFSVQARMDKGHGKKRGSYEVQVGTIGKERVMNSYEAIASLSS
ncbi:hypothetical protein ISCGN_003468 [Ixodes scapularis]